MSDHRTLDPKQERAIDVQPRISRAALTKWREHYVGAEPIPAPPGALLALRCLFGDEIAFYPTRGCDTLADLFFAPWPDVDADRPAGIIEAAAAARNSGRHDDVQQQTSGAGPLFGGGR